MEETYGLKDYSTGEPIYVRDPVCGTVVEQSKAPAKTSFDGETLYFCSNECKKKFEDEPIRRFGQAERS
jgi:YHS domain-containing protein